MPDHRFFKKPQPCSIGEIAALIGAELASGADPSHQIADVAPLDKAGAADLSFLDNVKYKEQYLHSKAGACVVSADMASLAPRGMQVLISKSPYKSYALAAQKFYPEERPDPVIAPSAHVHATAKIGRGCVIEAGAVIGEGAEIGPSCWIEAGAVVGSHVMVGEHCRIGAHASVYYTIMGAYVRIYPGARIGQDGFGFAIDPKGHVKVPQLGRVIIGDHVEIGANACVDRGSGPDTEIGSGTWIDNLVQVGHNVKFGRGCAIAAQVGISGSTEFGDFIAVGGQAGFAGHLKIGSGARIAGQAGVIQNVEPRMEVMGYPAMPLRQFLRQAAMLKRLVNPKKTV